MNNSTSTPSTSTPSGNDSPVPPVEHPLDATPYLDRPCDLVPPDLLTKLGYTDPPRPATPDTDSTAALSGPGCGWSIPRSVTTMQVSVQTGNQRDGMGGLQGLYDAYQNGQYVYWEPTTVVGYPAAYYNIIDDRSRGGCKIAVGIANDLTFSVTAGLYDDDPEQACPVVTEVATAVISTLKGQS